MSSMAPMSDASTDDASNIDDTDGCSFFALDDGPVPSPFEKDSEFFPQDTVNLTVVDLGVLRAPSGRVEACDPFCCLGDGPVFDVKPGDYPVRVTVADVSKEQDGSHEREAYLSLVLGDGKPVTVEEAVEVSGPDWGVAVDAGAVALVDHEAVATAMPAVEDGADWYSDLFDSGEADSWFNLMDSSEHYRAGMANIVMPLAEAGENVALSHSGWGDGVYPVVLTRDADGLPVGLHIDLGVVGTFAVDENDENDED